MASESIVWERFDAVLLDLDGVITATARVHAACWKEMFDAYREERTARGDAPFRPFEIEPDYRLHVDGKRRGDGARSFLASRGIDLPAGTPDSPPESETISGLAKRKDLLVKAVIERQGIEVYPDALAFVRAARRRGLKTAVVSSSRNCAAVLEVAGISDLFDVRVDGEVAARMRLPGKPAPDTFLHAAALLGVAADRAVVVEDALVGVAAGRAGGFGLVVGVDREGHGEVLRAHGADLAVRDLSILLD
jgi:beta-phosphoglucomutase family hydrolase